MSKKWTEEVLGTDKVIIAMCHFTALPGDPGFDEKGGMEAVVERARREMLKLQEGGVDAIMFSNEFSLPYLTKVKTETVAAMARIIGEIKGDLHIPFGVNVLWDPEKSLDLAKATGAKFVREIFTGVYASDFGIWDTNCGEVVRHQHAIGAQDVKLLFNIIIRSGKIHSRDNIPRLHTVFNCRPDALCVSGLTAGAATDSQVLKTVKNEVPQTIVFANTGVRKENVAEQLKIADGPVYLELHLKGQVL